MTKSLEYYINLQLYCRKFYGYIIQLYITYCIDLQATLKIINLVLSLSQFFLRVKKNDFINGDWHYSPFALLYCYEGSSGSSRHPRLPSRPETYART